jgi:hypothetical protein
MRLFVRIAAVLCALPLLAGCPELRAFNDALEQQMWQQNALGPAGVGLDMFLAGQEIRAVRGR